MPFPAAAAAAAAVTLATLRVSTTLRMLERCGFLTFQDADARLASFEDPLAAAAAIRKLITVRN